MRRLKLLGVLLLSLLVLSTLSSVSAFQRDIIPPAKAKQVAEYFAKEEFSENIEIGNYVLFYEPSGKPAVYSFEILKDGKIYGTIIIGATKDHAPLVMLYRGLPPQYNLNLKKRARNTKYLYPKPFTFIARYEVRDKNNNPSYMYIDLINGKRIHYRKKDFTNSVSSYNLKTRKEWTYVEKLISGEILPQYVNKSYKKIRGVPYFIADEGCALTAAAMVISYWRNLGYYNFPIGEEYLEDLFKQYFDYDPTTGGTTVSSIPPGYEEFTSDYGYSFDSWYLDGYWEYVSEIDNERPVTIALIGSETYGDHAVVGIGYEYVYPHSEYLWIHDGWHYYDVKLNVNEVQDIYYIYLRPN